MVSLCETHIYLAAVKLAEQVCIPEHEVILIERQEGKRIYICYLHVNCNTAAATVIPLHAYRSMIAAQQYSQRHTTEFLIGEGLKPNFTTSRTEFRDPR